MFEDGRYRILQTFQVMLDTTLALINKHKMFGLTLSIKCNLNQNLATSHIRCTIFDMTGYNMHSCLQFLTWQVATCIASQKTWWASCIMHSHPKEAKFVPWHGYISLLAFEFLFPPASNNKLVQVFSLFYLFFYTGLAFTMWSYWETLPAR